MERKPSYLSFEMFKQIVDPLPQGSYITLTGNGELLLNKKVYDMIEYASNRGVIVSLITNGTALTEKNSERLIKSGVSRIQISFASMDKDTYEETMKGAKFYPTLEKVLKFIYLARVEFKIPVYISISTVMTKEDKKYAKKSKEFWCSMPIDNYYEGQLLSLQTNSKAYNVEKIEKLEEWKPCITPWITVKIDADGAVTGCHHDFSAKYIIGNANDANILEILNSENALKLKKALLEGDIEYFKDTGYKCDKCNVWNKGKGYNLFEFIDSTFFIRKQKIMNEINKDNEYSQDKINILKQTLSNI